MKKKTDKVKPIKVKPVVKKKRAKTPVEKPQNKPNGVLFKLDNGQLCIVLLKETGWDWENVLHLQMDDLKDKFEDLSAVNPFEWVFIYFTEKEFTVCNQKTILPKMSFSQLYDTGVFTKLVQSDYERQYETKST